MLTFVPSKDEKTIAFEFTGNPVKEDAEKLEKVVEEKFNDKGKFNLYIVAYDVEIPSFTGMVERIKAETKYMNQIEKAVLISDGEWVEAAESIHKLVPGLETKHFKPTEMNEAWDWIQS